MLLEATTLFAIHRMGLLDELACWPGGLVVPAWLVEQLCEELWKLRCEAVPSGFAGSDGGHYYFHQVQPDIREQQLGSIQRMIEWIRSNTSLVANTDSLHRGKHVIDELMSVVGRQAAGAVFAAADCELPLASDDLALRRLAHQTGARSLTWSQPIIKGLRNRGIIDDAQYRMAVAFLGRRNYVCVSINADDLQWAWGARLEDRGFFDGILHCLRAEACSGESAGRIAGIFLGRLWKSQESPTIRLLALDAVLGTITRARRAEDWVEAYERYLTASLGPLATLQIENLIAETNRWLKVRLLV